MYSSDFGNIYFSFLWHAPLEGRGLEVELQQRPLWCLDLPLKSSTGHSGPWMLECYCREYIQPQLIKICKIWRSYLSRKKDKIMVMAGLEKNIAVESPSGNLEAKKWELLENLNQTTVGYIPGDSLHHGEEKETTKSTLTNNPPPEEGVYVNLRLGIDERPLRFVFSRWVSSFANLVAKSSAP